MSPTFPDDLKHVRDEAIATVFSRLPGTLVVSLINAGLIVMVMENSRLSRGPFLWLGLVAILTAVRAWVYQRYRVDPERERHGDFWARTSVAGALCAGALWGAGPLVESSGVASYQWLWAFAIGGMCAGAASLHAAHLKTALAFILPAALPLAISLLLQGSLEGIAAAIMTFAFIGLTTFTAILFSQDFQRLKLLHLALAARVEEVEDTHRRLSKEMADHRATSEALYQSQKMEALGNLTGGFAHDFNNILTVIISNLELIAHGMAPRSSRELAISAISAAESGADLIARLLAFARKRTVTAEHCNVVAAVTEFSQLLQHAVSGRISVEFDLADPDATAKFDIAQFQAMLLNLFVNARDAMPDGGVITLSVTTVPHDEQGLAGIGALPGPFVRISVADTGIGMTPETVERAFEPFFSTKTERGGTGLGLAQVYGFARQSGGFCRIDSAPGKGSRVSVFVPASEPGESVAGHEAKEAPTPVRAPLSILLVDDNAAVLTSLAHGLQEEGWTVRCVESPHEAIVALEAGETYDIIVTDIDMPGDMNGERLAQEIRNRFGIPALLMSGAAISSEAEYSGLPIISKPFRKAALVAAIAAVVDRR